MKAKRGGETNGFRFGINKRIVLFPFFTALIAIFLISISIGFAGGSIEVLKDYAPGETAQAIIAVDSFDIKKLSLEKDGEKITIAPIAVELNKSMYFFYFNLPSDLAPGDYNLTYLVREYYNLTWVRETEEAVLSVVNSSYAIAVSPAAVVLNSKEDRFQITIKNSGLPISLNISSESSAIEPARKTIELESGEAKELSVKYTSLENAALLLSYGDREYTIPLYFIEAEAEAPEEDLTAVEPEIPEPEKEAVLNISFVTQDISKIANSSTALRGNISFRNYLDYSLKNITLEPTDNLLQVLELEKYFFSEIGANETISVEAVANAERNATGSFSGNIILKTAEGFSDELLVELLFIAPPTVEVVNETIANKTIPAINISQFLNYTIIEKPEEDKVKNVVIGIILVVLLLLIALFLFVKLRKKEKALELKEYLRKIKKR